MKMRVRRQDSLNRASSNAVRSRRAFRRSGSSLPACGPEKPPIHTIRQPSAGCARSERSRMSCRVLRTRSARPQMSLKPQKHEQRRPCPRQAGRVPAEAANGKEVVPVQIKIESAVVQQAQARLRQQSGAMRAVAVNVSSVLNGLDMQIAATQQIRSPPGRPRAVSGRGFL